MTKGYTTRYNAFSSSVVLIFLEKKLVDITMSIQLVVIL